MIDETSSAVLSCWHHGPVASDVLQALDKLSRTEGVSHLAAMPDVHVAGDVCNGVVLASRDRVFPDAVGGDIGCGMIAVPLKGEVAHLEDGRKARWLLDGLSRVVPTLRHRKESHVPPFPEELLERPLRMSALEKRVMRDGRWQLGTLGRGNHFVEFQCDQEGALWLMVHSGSRGMGQAIRGAYVAQAQRSNTGLPYLLVGTPEADNYLHDMAWALDYAWANREAMVSAVLALVEDAFGWSRLSEGSIHMHHNHVQHEEHFGERLWVHRKGANAAFSGMPGIIPGSMGTKSFLVEGRGHQQALCSSSHGAGRILRRKDAFRSISEQELDRQMRGVWFADEYRSSLRDEAPGAYKSIRHVMRAQRELVKITRELCPLLVHKGV